MLNLKKTATKLKNSNCVDHIDETEKNPVVEKIIWSDGQPRFIAVFPNGEEIIEKSAEKVEKSLNKLGYNINIKLEDKMTKKKTAEEIKRDLLKKAQDKKGVKEKSPEKKAEKKSAEGGAENKKKAEKKSAEGGAENKKKVEKKSAEGGAENKKKATLKKYGLLKDGTYKPRPGTKTEKLVNALKEGPSTIEELVEKTGYDSVNARTAIGILKRKYNLFITKSQGKYSIEE